MNKSIWTGLAVAIVMAATAAACGGGSSSGGGTATSTTPTSPTAPTTPTAPTNPTTPTTPTTPTDSATITIGADGRVTPSTVTITRGGRVTMVNNHNRAHDMASDPHPEHTTCPELNQWGFLQAGQQRTSGNLNTARTCGFHDHNEPNNNGLKGQVIIQ
jgi:plastocyanin